MAEAPCGGPKGVTMTEAPCEDSKGVTMTEAPGEGLPRVPIAEAPRGGLTSVRDLAIGAEVVVRGHVLSKRTLSKRLFFFDIIEDALAAPPDALIAECMVVCSDGGFDEADVKRLRKLVVTSFVEVEGTVEQGKHNLTIAARRLVTLSTFDDDPAAVGNARATVKNNSKTAGSESSRAVLLSISRHTARLDREKRPGQPQLCRGWWRGTCQKSAEKCPRRHAYADAAERRKYEALAAKTAAAREAEKDLGDPHADGSKSDKKHRTTFFARWLLDTFGGDACNAGSGVLDIAGGTGAISFELHVKHGVRCTLVDPRPPKMGRFQYLYLERKAREERKLRQESPEPANSGSESGSEPEAANGGLFDDDSAEEGEAEDGQDQE
eukprot:gene20536-31626_t